MGVRRSFGHTDFDQVQGSNHAAIGGLRRNPQALAYFHIGQAFHAHHQKHLATRRGHILNHVVQRIQLLMGNRRLFKGGRGRLETGGCLGIEGLALTMLLTSGVVDEQIASAGEQIGAEIGNRSAAHLLGQANERVLSQVGGGLFATQATIQVILDFATVGEVQRLEI